MAAFRRRSTGALALFAWLVAGPVPAGELDAVFAKSPNLSRGAEIYRTCAACHGEDGGGVDDGSVPAISGQPPRVLAKQIVDFRAGSRKDLRMEHFADRRHLESAQDIADVAAYAAGLERRTRVGTGDGSQLRAGASAFVSQCAGCHGASGRGDPNRMLPALAGQHAAYLERQLRDTADGRRPNMSPQHRAMLRRFGDAQFVGVADYLSRMRR